MTVPICPTEARTDRPSICRQRRTPCRSPDEEEVAEEAASCFAACSQRHIAAQKYRPRPLPFTPGRMSGKENQVTTPSSSETAPMPRTGSGPMEDGKPAADRHAERLCGGQSREGEAHRLGDAVWRDDRRNGRPHLRRRERGTDAGKEAIQAHRPEAVGKAAERRRNGESDEAAQQDDAAVPAVGQRSRNQRKDGGTERIGARSSTRHALWRRRIRVCSVGSSGEIRNVSVPIMNIMRKNKVV